MTVTVVAKPGQFTTDKISLINLRFAKFPQALHRSRPLCRDLGNLAKRRFMSEVLSTCEMVNKSQFWNIILKLSKMYLYIAIQNWILLLLTQQLNSHCINNRFRVVWNRVSIAMGKVCGLSLLEPVYVLLVTSLINSTQSVYVSITDLII